MDIVKVKIICDLYEKENINNLFKESITIVENDEDYIFIKKELYDRDKNTIVAFYNQEYHRIKLEDIIYIEAIRDCVYAYTEQNQYLLKEKLYELATKFNSSFLRVSKSFIVNIQKIDKIKPHINRKFLLTMINGVKIDVTRTYYLIFKEFFDI